MAIEGLNIIGESINDSVPSTNKLFEANDINGLKELAKLQDENGAAYIDVNVGRRSAEFMAQIVKEVQGVTYKPLSIDTPDYEIAKAGLEAYDMDIAKGSIPILNSISPLRTKMFDLYDIQPFMPILLVSERIEGTESKPCHTTEETYQAAKDMLKEMNEIENRLKIENCIFDVGIAPIASDSESMTKRTLESIKMIHDDPVFKGVHFSVGLSNFTVMLPPKTADGMPVKSTLESAFITKAMKSGLDMIVGSVKRNYQLLEDDHPAMQCVTEALELDGFDIIMRVQKFYS